MKKFAVFILALLLLCTSVLFAGCQPTVEKKTPFEIVNGAMAKTRELDAFAVEMDMKVGMVMDGTTLEVPVNAKIKAKDLDKDAPVIQSTISTSVFGFSMVIEMYQENDWAYLIAEDTKYKVKTTDLSSEYDYTDDVQNMLKDLPEELFEALEMVTNEDGSQSVTLSIPEEKFAEIYAEYIQGVDTGTELSDVRISDTKIKVTVADEYIQAMEMSFAMNITVDGTTTATSVSASITYSEPGEEITITPPEGYQDFEELSY